MKGSKFSKATVYAWRKRYAGLMPVGDAIAAPASLPQHCANDWRTALRVARTPDGTVWNQAPMTASKNTTPAKAAPQST